ncbi:hypothetical protein PP747_gp008 [Rhizobium phage RHph_Y38]|uniref:Uncharacterized protein n=1 Tax=Rhizobium phage RHph_Y38 TaxID=2509781 RepID=A0A7S5R8X3_9CAUD|nr:hypothetical protein PP747_gp008 [Rhizobium phage RHph_Y38]QIG67709.1 hypothetical protein EVB52_008 [Rhizobium phage RHph_Y38]
MPEYSFEDLQKMQTGDLIHIMIQSFHRMGGEDQHESYWQDSNYINCITILNERIKIP